MKRLITKVYIYYKKIRKKLKYTILKLKGLHKIKSDNHLTGSYQEALKVVENYRKMNIINENLMLKKNTLDLSIIIPVYNAEKTIYTCINSIIMQHTNYKFEVICINDGSTDHSVEVIDKIKDKRIKVINQENRGAAKARNVGLSKAIGRYIMFIDSDDFLPNENIVELLLKQANLQSADIVAGNIKKYIEKFDISIYNTKHKQTTTNNLLKMCKLTEGAPWGKIYKKDLWKNVCFPEGVEFEDCVVFLNIYPNVKKFVYIDKIVYCFRSNNNSLYKRSQQDFKCIDSFWSIYASYKMLRNKKDINIDHIQLYIWHLSAIMSARIKNVKDTNIKKSIILLSKELITQIITNSKFTDEYIAENINKPCRKILAILQNGTVEEWSKMSELILLSEKI